jgi:hypothetical protein
MTFFMDGAKLGATTQGVPATSMHWVLQCETRIDGQLPADGSTAHVYLDWVAVWDYTGSPTIPADGTGVVISDTFAAANTDVWNGYLFNQVPNGIAVAGGDLVCTPTKGYPLLFGVTGWNFATGTAVWEVTQAVGTGGSVASGFGVRLNDYNNFSFSLSQNSLVCREQVHWVDGDDAGRAFSLTNHKWLRIRVSGATVFWESSPNNSTWTILRQKAWALPRIDDMVPFMGAGYWNDADAGTLTAMRFGSFSLTV